MWLGSQLPTLHCTVIGLTRERFVALGLPSWMHLRTRYFSVFTMQVTRRFASCVWPTVLWKLGHRWKWKGESWFNYRKVLFVGAVGITETWFYSVQGATNWYFRGAKWCNLLLYRTNTYVFENFGGAYARLPPPLVGGWFSVVRKITASRKNSGELLGDDVMKTASHRNCTLQVTLIEFEQFLQGRKWEFVSTMQSHFVDLSHDH